MVKLILKVIKALYLKCSFVCCCKSECEIGKNEGEE